MEKNMYDEAGKKTGFWKEVRGSEDTIGVYISGKEVGEWKHVNIKKGITRFFNYKEGNLHGEFKVFENDILIIYGEYFYNGETSEYKNLGENINDGLKFHFNL